MSSEQFSTEYAPITAKQIFKFTALLLLFSAIFYSCVDLPSTAFNQTAWQAGGRKTRGSMVRNIIDTQLLMGKTKQEVIDLLGQPTSVYAPHNSFSYSINTDFLCLFSPCDMLVYFNEGNKRVSFVAKADW